MPKKLKKIKSHTIDLKKDWDEAHIFFFDPLDSIENFIKRIDDYLHEVILSQRDIDEYLSDIAKWYRTKSINEYSKEFLKKLKAEYTSINKDYPYKNAWELWEIILTILQKRYLWAIKVVSKMWNRDSIKFNVLWRDTSFVYKDIAWKICMLVWESKLSVNSKDKEWKISQDSLDKWLVNAHDDLEKFYNDTDYLNHEINLASKCLKDEMNEENRDIFIQYFIKENPKHSELVFKNVIFVWYTHNEYMNFKNWWKSESEYIEELLLDIQNSFYSDKIKSRKETLNKNSIYFLLPFECVEKARKAFVEHNNLEYE